MGQITRGKQPMRWPSPRQYRRFSCERSRPHRVEAPSSHPPRRVQMTSLVGRMVRAVGVAALLVTLFGSSFASADALTGHTYSDAAAALSEIKGTPVVATV